jgi:hypothetical protein
MAMPGTVVSWTHSRDFTIDKKGRFRGERTARVGHLIIKQDTINKRATGDYRVFADASGTGFEPIFIRYCKTVVECLAQQAPVSP